MRRIRWMFAAALGCAVLTTGCKTLPPSKPLSELTAEETAGYEVYQARCARCHHANSTRSLNGPGLQALYKQPYLPSGAPANDERIRAAIVHGRNMMPASANGLDDQQLANLMAYLHTL